MAGIDTVFDRAMPMNAIGFFGLHLATAGSDDGKEIALEEPDGYKKLFVKDNRLVGLMLIGDIRRCGIYTRLIREQVPLDTIDFELMKQHPQLMAFSPAARAELLGGAK